MKITIDTMNAHRDDVQELKDYLEEKSWSFETDEKEEEDNTLQTTLIQLIQKYVNEREDKELSTCDLEADHSPIISSKGDTYTSVEILHENYVEAYVYVDDNVVNQITIPYTELEIDVLEDIVTMLGGSLVNERIITLKGLSVGIRFKEYNLKYDIDMGYIEHSLSKDIEHKIINAMGQMNCGSVCVYNTDTKQISVQYEVK